jgi:O-antigen/teichoic acid export membrane protein
MKKQKSIVEAQLITITKNAFLGIGGQLYFMFLLLGTAILITRKLGPELYGIVILAMNITAIVKVISLMGFEQTMVRFIAKYKAQKNISLVKGVVKFCLRITLIIILALSLVIFLATDFIANIIFNKPELAAVLRVLIFSLPFISCMLILISALQGAKLVKYKIFIEKILMPTFRFVSIAVILWLGFRLMGVVWARVLTSIVGFIAAYFIIIKKIGSLFEESASVDAKEIMSFSLPLLLSRLFYQNVNTVAILIIGFFFPAAEVGIFGVAMRTIPFLLIPFIAYNMIFSPIVSDLFTSGRTLELETIYKIGSKWVIFITLPLFILMCFFCDQIASIFGPEFKESAKIMVVLYTGQMASVFAGSSGLILTMTGKTILNLINACFLFILNIILTVVLINKCGVIGAAYAHSASRIIIHLLQIAEVWYLYRIQPYKIEHLKIIIASSITFLLTYILSKIYFIPTNTVSTIVLVSFFLLSYLSFIIIFGLSSEDHMVVEKIKNKLINRK